MTDNREIISKGRCVRVSDAELEELRNERVSWLAYCQRRLTMDHRQAVQDLTKFRRL